MTTLNAMTSNVRTDLVIDPNGDVWSDTTIKRFINEFVGEVYSWDGIPVAETTGTVTLVASTATYDLAAALSDYGDLQSLRLDGKTQLLEEVIDLNEFENGRDLTQEGEPTHYYFYGDDTIGLYPVPDGNITTLHARYNSNAPTLGNTDEPSWNERWHYVCELYARWRCFSTVPGHETMADRAQVHFIRERAKMQEDLWSRSVNGLSMANTNPGVWPDGGTSGIRF